MTGERLYAIHRQAARDFYYEPLPAWEFLDWRAKQFWEDRAVEQGLRDQPECGTLHGRIDE